MAVQQETKAERDNTILLLFVVFSIICIMSWWGFCWYQQVCLGGLDRIQHLKVIFQNVSGLNDHADVYLDGVKVGQVEGIHWLSSKHVLVRLRIKKALAKITRQAKFSVLTNGLLGAKYIAIELPDLDQHVPSAIADENHVFQGEPTAQTELALAKLTGLVNRFDADRFASSWNSDRQKLVRAADSLALASNKLIPLEESAMPVEREVLKTSRQLRLSIRHFEKLLSDPGISQNMKEVVQSARQTAENIQIAIQELNKTLENTALRHDIIAAFSNLNEAAARIDHSSVVVKNLISDEQVRNDLKQILSDARYSIERLEEITRRPGLEAEIHSTLGSTREALDKINLAAAQINQILDKRMPLIHLFLGRPGHIDIQSHQQY